MKGSTSARGYGTSHQQTRAAWKPSVDAGEVTCWRCGRLIVPGSPWDLGHVDGDKSSYRGPEHSRCSRSAGGRLGAAVRNAKRQQRQVFSRAW